jgi:pyruvate dehydrogenase E2 component (dihydrolipoamide acetyltransferase)
MNEFVMPKLGSDMTAGTLVSWRKKPNEAVHRGDIMAEVDTDKGVIDIEAFQEGILDKILIEPGAHVPVGTTLAMIRADGEVSAESGSSVKAKTLPVASQPVEPQTQESDANKPPLIELSLQDLRRLKISPSARMLARQLGVDPRQVKGTGRDGAITRDDIDKAGRATSPPAKKSAPPKAPASISTPGPAAETPRPVVDALDRAARMRQAIAAAMARSNREIPHYYLSTTIDLHRAMDWLTEQNEQRGVTDRLLYGVLLLKAVALALRESPELNAFWQNDQAELQDDIHLGVAVSLRGGGLIAPAIHHADLKSLDELMRDLRDLVKRVRSGGLKSSELSDPTVTVTNLGEQGVEGVFGVINPPQVAIVGFGKVGERPWVVDGQVMPRPVICASLAADHRATDGHLGGIFLTNLGRILQEPELL